MHMCALLLILYLYIRRSMNLVFAACSTISNINFHRIITSPMFGGRGQLTVGGVSGSISSSDFYSGDLQDVRVFSTALTQK